MRLQAFRLTFAGLVSFSAASSAAGSDYLARVATPSAHATPTHVENSFEAVGLSNGRLVTAVTTAKEAYALGPLDADGNALAGLFVSLPNLNGANYNEFWNISVAALAGGRFSVSWDDFYRHPNNPSFLSVSIWTQIYDSNLIAKTQPQQLNSIVVTGGQSVRSAALANGDYVVCHTDWAISGNLQCHVRDPNGVSKTFFSTNLYHDKYGLSMVGLKNGNFVIADGDSPARKAEVLTPTGGVVKTIDLGATASFPSVTALENGFVIAKHDVGGSVVTAQIFDNAGNLSKPITVAPTNGALATVYPVATTLANGDFVVAWSDSVEKAKVFSPNGIEVTGTFQIGDETNSVYSLSPTPRGFFAVGPTKSQLIDYRSGAPRDFSGDGKSDILWRSATGDAAVSLMSGATITSSIFVANLPTNWVVAGTGDFNFDGKSDILWRNSNTGDTVVSLMQNATITSSTLIANVPTSWSVAGTGDFDGNGKSDILWRNNSGDAVVSLMNGASIVSSTWIANLPVNWVVSGVGDFNSDGAADILWRNANGDVAVSLMNGPAITSSTFVANLPPNWTISGVGDVNGDRKVDILWRDTGAGHTVVSLMDGGTIRLSTLIGTVPLSWTIGRVGDFNSDGFSDILWRSTTGAVVVSFMAGTTISSSTLVANLPNSWTF